MNKWVQILLITLQDVLFHCINISDSLQYVKGNIEKYFNIIIDYIELCFNDIKWIRENIQSSLINLNKNMKNKKTCNLVNKELITLLKKILKEHIYKLYFLH